MRGRRRPESGEGERNGEPDAMDALMAETRAVGLREASVRPTRTLLLELWGLGDAVMMTGALRALIDSGREVTVACASGTRDLLGPSFPEVAFRVYEAPWKAFRGKYRIWRWDNRALAGFVRGLREQRFDEAASVRPDPRDHLLMFLSGSRVRAGIPWKPGTRFLLNAPLPRVPLRHKVEDWQALAARLTGKECPALPALDASRCRGPEIEQLLGKLSGDSRPRVIVLHCGARIAVRRWEASRFREIVHRLRPRFSFHLALVPDPDGYGSELEDEADSFHPKLSLDEMVALLGRAELMIGNDSAPGHIAAALGTPTLTFFGPTSPEMFRPYGTDHHVVIRDLCIHRPCFDYCRFPEPYCMTRLTVDDTWTEVEQFVAQIWSRLPGLQQSTR